MTTSRRIHDPILFGLALLATLLGLFFIFDAGYARSLRDHSVVIPREFYMQIPFLLVALVASAVIAGIRPEKWKLWSKGLWVFSLLLLIAVELPGIGHEMSGAHRWIKIGPLLLQPAEFVKISTILYLAGLFADRKAWPKKLPHIRDFGKRVDSIWIPKLVRCLPGLWVLLAIILIEREPDLGTAAVVAAIAAVMFVVGGVTRKTLVAGALVSIVGVGIMVQLEPYRMERITNHAHIWSDENIDSTGYQTVQSQIAMASGGLAGVGVGAGRAKHVLPATTTDFINATIAEEFGFFGMAVVITVIGGLVWRLMTLALEAKDRFAMLVLTGVAGWIAIQATTNIMMANGLLPAIGIPLPFVSSGGSSLIALWMAMGLCQSVLAPARAKEETEVATGRNRWRHRRTRLSRA